MDKNLVYDVGMNDGEDTARYLGLGYNVVAIEADPVLCGAARERFADVVGERLIILSVAVAATEGPTLFWVNRTRSGWSSVFEPLGQRQDGGDMIVVYGQRFGTILRQYGVPLYLKSDIEGSDFLCLDALWEIPEDERPTYISVEAANPTWFPMLRNLGYSRFALVDQTTFNPPEQQEKLSGPFPTEIKEWVDFETFLAQWEEVDHRETWYDLYAAMEEP